MGIIKSICLRCMMDYKYKLIVLMKLQKQTLTNDQVFGLNNREYYTYIIPLNDFSFIR